MQFLTFRLFLCLGLVPVFAAAPSAELRRSCSKCHPLAVVEKQRLSRAEWDIELKKMEKMGAKVTNRRALLDFLSKKYGAK